MDNSGNLMKMKKIAFVLIIVLTLFASRAAGQCTIIRTITGPASVCAASTGNIYITESGMTNYVWSVPAGGLITAGSGTNSVTVTWNTAGAQTITVNYEDTDNCTAPAATIYNVTVNSLPVPTITGMAIVCAGSTGVTYSTESLMTGYTWAVSAGGNITGGSGSNSITVNWNTPGAETVSVNYTNSNSCTATSPVSRAVTVNPLPVPTINGLTSVCAGTSGVSYITEAGMTDYTWNVSPGGAITGGSTNNSITVNWNSSGGQSVSVNYTNSNNCSAASPVVRAVTVNPLPVPTITGPAPACVNSSINVYTTETLMTGYTWDISSGGIITSGHLTNSVNVAWNTVGPQTLSVTYTNSNNCIPLTPSVYNINVNPKPLPFNVQISGTLKTGSVLTAGYNFNPGVCSPEVLSKTEISWFRADDNNGLNSSWMVTKPGTDKTYLLTASDQNKYFQICVKLSDGSIPLAATVCSSGWFGPVVSNDPPSAGTVTITGLPQVKKILTGHYSYSDTENDLEGTTTFQWWSSAFSNGAGAGMIAGARSITYELKSGDRNRYIALKVTPVALTGTLTGPEMTSAWVGPINNLPPVATNVNISGALNVNSGLTGHYLFTDAEEDPESGSTFQWYSSSTWNGTYSQIPSETGIAHVITMEEQGKFFKFYVTPRTSSGSSPGIEVASAEYGPANTKPYADNVAITGLPEVGKTLKGSYSYHDVDPADYEATSTFRWLRNGVPIPGATLDTYLLTKDDETYKIIFEVTPVSTPGYPYSGAPALSPETAAILPISAHFSGYKNIYCHDNGTDTINVSNIPISATNLIFRLTNPAGLVSTINDTTIIIDPGRMRPGNKVDTLIFSYKVGTSAFPIYLPFIIDSVGTNLSMVNIDTAYCTGSVKRYITVEGTYPGGGTANWTGTLFSDKTPTSAFLDPLLGTAGVRYPLTYQYISPYGCRSQLISKKVKINYLPNSSFILNATYNIDGGDKILLANTPGGNYVGPGVIGNKFYPDIAGQGTHEIKYYLTDLNGCSSNTPKTTIVRKVQGLFNNLPSIICYRDTIFNISVTGTPDSITIIDFINSKNSLGHVPGSANAAYNIANAGPGYDTIKLSYTWGGVDYTLSKTVYIDSIGKIAITGLKDNYCEYEGTTTLRVLVENSTGNGNFGFSGPDSSFTNFGNLADFFPSKTPTSATPYTVSYTHVSTVNNSGCRRKVEIPVTVNKKPVVGIIKTRTTVNYEETPILLEGVPSGGNFSGKGIYKQGGNYVFNPMVAGMGEIEVLLSYTDSVGCFASDRDTLIVSKATGVIQGINAGGQYCKDGLNDTLKFESVFPYFSGSFIGTGITNISPDEAVFNPGLARKGDHKIVYRYSDMAGTIFDVSAQLNIDSIGLVSINNLSPGDVFCNNDPLFPLFTSHADGVFTGPVTGTSLNPSIEVGNTSVGYTYTNSKTGCTGTTNIPVIINAAPVISFVPADYCVESNLDTTRFINKTSSADPVNDWLWIFSDAGGSTQSKIKEPGYLYKTGGLHKVTLTAETINNCSAIKEMTIDLGIKPIADFYWKNECFVKNDSISLVDTTFSTSLIASRSWKIFEGPEFSTKENPKYLKSDTGYLQIQYIVKTNYENCFDDTIKKIYIRPSVSLAADTYYSQTFENGKGGWVKDYESKNSWSFGKPDRRVINSAPSGVSAWFTSYDTLRQGVESSSVISPCFDFKEIKRPMISLKIWKRFDRNRNGAALQYKIGDNASWEYVGTLNDGINWYNSSLISGRPGGDKIGWTTTGQPETKWAESLHELDELQGKSNVKFRIVYGSDGTSTDNEGIAFDDIRIGARTRNVLLEHFANISSLQSSKATAMVNEIVLGKKKDIINIQYHTNFPGTDPFYNSNPGDASARILFYGLTMAPYSFIDGGNNKENYANSFDYNLADIDSNDVARRSLVNPRFNISLNSKASGGVLSVSGKITALEDINSDNITLYLAVTEKESRDTTGANGEKIFYNVFRKFIPNAGGIDLKKSWKVGDSLRITDQTWVIERIKSSSDIEVVAFIQNNISKELYQTVSAVDTTVIVGIEKLLQRKGNNFAIYPNPVVNRLTISFREPLNHDSDIRIYDLRGIVISIYKAASGLNEFTIEDPRLRNGIYLVRVSSGGIDLGFKKLIISGK
jgi:hypothetical protein